MINLEEISTKYKVFVDTCSFLNEGSKIFFEDKLLSSLTKNNTRIIVPLKVLKELDRLRNSGSNINRGKVENALKILNK